VRPRDLTCEPLEEQGRRDGPAADVRIRGDVREVGHAGLEGRAVLLHQGHPPQPFPGCLPRREQARRERLFLGEQRGMPLAQAEGRRAGERRDVDDGVGLERLSRPDERVGEHEAPLGVGVEDLDGGAVGHPHHVTRAIAGAADGVLRQRDHRGDAVRQLGFRGGEGRGQHGRSPGHVRLHRDHGVAVLDGQTAGVEGDALADENRVAAPSQGPGGRVVDHHEPGRGGRGPADREDATHPPLGEPRLVVDVHRGAGDRRGGRAGLLGEPGRVLDVRRRRGEPARQHGGASPVLRRRHRLGRLPPQQNEALGRRRGAGAQTCARRTVGREEEAFDEGSHRVVVTLAAHGGEDLAEALGGAAQRRPGPAQVSRTAVTHADQHHPLGQARPRRRLAPGEDARKVDPAHLAGSALEPVALGEVEEVDAVAGRRIRGARPGLEVALVPRRRGGDGDGDGLREVLVEEVGGATGPLRERTPLDGDLRQRLQRGHGGAGVALLRRRRRGARRQVRRPPRARARRPGGRRPPAGRA